MARKTIKFELGKIYESKFGEEENVVIRRTESAVWFKPYFALVDGSSAFFRRKVKVIKTGDGKKVECCNALERKNGKMFANILSSRVSEDDISPYFEKPEVIVTEKPEEPDLPYYSEKQLMEVSGVKKCADKRTHNQYAYKNFGGMKNEIERKKKI